MIFLSSKFSNLLATHYFSGLEPTVFLLCFWHELSFFVSQNLYLQKTCRDDALSEPDLDTPCDDERRGLVYVSTVFNNAEVIGTCWALFFGLYASSYSDVVGGKRRIFMIMSLVGMTVQAAWTVLQIVFWHWPPLLGIIVNAVLANAFGGFSTMVCFIHAYLCDVTSNENRLIKIIVVATANGAGSFLGKGSVGFLLRRGGFLVTGLVCVALPLVNLVSTMVFVKEAAPVSDGASSTPKVSWKSQIFSLKPLYEPLKVILFPKKPAKVLASIWILLLISSLLYFPLMGEKSVVYLYLRYRFHWSEEKYSTYVAFRILSLMFGSMLCSLVMKKCFKIHEAIIGAFAAFFDTLSVIGFYFAEEDWQLYAVTLFDMFHGVASCSSVTFVSLFFTEKEFGRLNSVKTIFSTVAMCGIPVYSMLFKSTMDTHPAAFFLLSIVLNAVTGILCCVAYFLTGNVESVNEKTVDEGIENHS